MWEVCKGKGNLHETGEVTAEAATIPRAEGTKERSLEEEACHILAQTSAEALIFKKWALP